MNNKTSEIKEIKFCPTCCTIRSGTVGGIVSGAIGGAVSYIISKIQPKILNKNVISSPVEVKIASSYIGGFAFLSSFVLFLHHLPFDAPEDVIGKKTKSGSISGGLAGFVTASTTYGLTVKLFDGHNAMRFLRWTVPSVILGSIFGYYFSVTVWQKLMIKQWYGDVCIPPTKEEIEAYQKAFYKNEYK